MFLSGWVLEPAGEDLDPSRPWLAPSRGKVGSVLSPRWPPVVLYGGEAEHPFFLSRPLLGRGELRG